MDYSTIPLFLKYSLVTTFSYYFLHTILYYFYPPFLAIKPAHKQWYVISNLIKSLSLFLMSFPAIFLLWNIYSNQNWNVDNIRYLATIYAVLDTVSLFMVPKMQKNTIIHHCSVFALYVVCMIYHFQKNSIAELICVYAVWSSFAYLVNLYLAIRIFIPNKDNLLTILCFYSYYIYFVCCFFNWSYQFYHMYDNVFNHPFSLEYVLYGFLLINLVYDDCVLMKYLYTNKKPILNHNKKQQ
tara:strand:+ start:958 stop:1677 length:720 start_codon:yes stop_codon:yes gene_type:complete